MQSGRPWTMVDRPKIEINIAHNFFCCLALTDFNNHLNFTVVDEKKTERFYFNSEVEKQVTRYTDYITPLHIKCHCVTDTGVKMKVWQLYSQL